MGKGHGYNGVPWNWKYCRFCNTNSWNNCKLMTYQCDFFFRCGRRSICFLCRFFQHFLNFIVIVCVSLRHWWNTIAVTCPNCSYGQAYFMQIQIRSADEPMTTFYKCCNIDCSHRWKENWILGLAPIHFCWVWFFYCPFMHMPSMILHYPAHDIGMTLKSQEQPECALSCFARSSATNLLAATDMTKSWDRCRVVFACSRWIQFHVLCGSEVTIS